MCARKAGFKVENTQLPVGNGLMNLFMLTAMATATVTKWLLQ